MGSGAAGHGKGGRPHLMPHDLGGSRVHVRPWMWVVPALLVLVIDLLSTWWALARLWPHRSVVTLGGLLTFQLVENTGVAFGVGAGHLAIVGLLEGIGIVVLALVAARAHSRSTAIGLGAALGGGLGNFIQRFIQLPGLAHGAVTDWIHLSFYPPTFNLADLSLRVGLLVAGAAALLRARRSHSAWTRRNTLAGRS